MFRGNLDAALLAGRLDAALAQMSYLNPLLESEKGAATQCGVSQIRL